MSVGTELPVTRGSGSRCGDSFAAQQCQAERTQEELGGQGVGRLITRGFDPRRPPVETSRVATESPSLSAKDNEVT